MPRWWYSNAPLAQRLTVWLLIPLSWLYQLGRTLRNFISSPAPTALPTLCIGNVTTGGAGKTPTTLLIANLLTQQGHIPHIISRGYGSEAARNSTPTRVNSEEHTAAQVGDEPLMMAQHFPVWVGKNRATSITAAKEADATIALLDDGLQNPTIAKTTSLLVLDGGFGLGNGHILPAGPLREPLNDALKKCSAALIIGEDMVGCDEQIDAANPNIPAFHIASETMLPDAAFDQPLFAFAGLARPEKFFTGIANAGGDLAAMHGFPDHHPYQAEEIEMLLEEADAIGAQLITTEKDMARIPAQYHNDILVAPLELLLDEGDRHALEELFAHHFPIA